MLFYCEVPEMFYGSVGQVVMMCKVYQKKYCWLISYVMSSHKSCIIIS